MGNLSGFTQRVIDYTYISSVGWQGRGGGRAEGHQSLLVTQGTRLMTSFHDYSIWNMEFTRAGKQSTDTIIRALKRFIPEMTQLGSAHSLLARAHLEAPI